MKIIDITGTIEPGMWSDADHPSVKAAIGEIPRLEVVPLTDIAKHGWSMHRICLTSTTATYFETPACTVKGAITLEEVPPEKFMTDCAILRVPRKGPREHITLEELSNTSTEILKGDAVIVDSGWYHMWNKPNFVIDSPYFTRDAIKWLLAKDISIFVCDVPCADDPFTHEDVIGGNVNDMQKKGVFLVAPVVNLDKITRKRARLVALAPKVKGVASFPCRALVLED